MKPKACSCELGECILHPGRAGKQASYVEVRSSACHAGSDGDCYWSECPQEKNYQTSCPLLAVPAPPPVSATFAESQVTIRDAIQPEGGDGSLGKVVPVPSPQPVSALRERQAIVMVQKLYDYFQGPSACGNFTCNCGSCGLCDFRKEVEAWLAAALKHGPEEG